MSLRGKKHSERGAALIVAVVLLGVLGLFGTAYWQHLHFTLKAARDYAKEQSAEVIAESGIAVAVAQLRAGQAPAAGVSQRVGEGYYTLRVTPGAEGTTEIASTGAFGEPGKPVHARTVRVRVAAGGAKVEYLQEAEQ